MCYIVWCVAHCGSDPIHLPIQYTGWVVIMYPYSVVRVVCML